MKKDGLRFAKGGSKKKKKNKNNKIEEKRPVEVEEIDREDFVVVGKNPVTEVLKSDIQVERVLILKDNTDHILAAIKDRAKKKNLVVQSVEKAKLDELADGRPHQGVAVLTAPYEYKSLDDVLKNSTESEIVVLCDHITDPHNFGAIIRNAEVCGAKAVIFPSRRSAGLSPAAVKASSGAAAYLDLVKVANLAQAIGKLKEAGYWIAGADMSGTPYYDCDLKGKLALVLGSEDTGMGQNIKKLCDFLVGIPDYGKVDSMNVSAAAAVILSDAARQQHQ